MADVVIAKNESDSAFRGKYNNVPFVIPAGGDQIIDREAAIVWFGDWNARNIGDNEHLQYRSKEELRLRGMYGASFDDPRDDPRIPEPKTGEQKWETNRPRIKLFETDGKPIVSVLDDPDGTDLPIEQAPTENLAAAMADMQKQIADMQSRLEKAQEAAATVEIPEDDPGEAPKRRRGPVTVDASRGE